MTPNRPQEKHEKHEKAGVLTVPPSVYIYMEYIRNIWGISTNIHNIKDKWAETKNTQAPPSPQWGSRLRRPPHWVCVFCFCYFLYIMNIYGYSLYIPYIFHKYFPHVFLCVCSYFIPSTKDKSLSQNHVYNSSFRFYAFIFFN